MGRIILFVDLFYRQKGRQGKISRIDAKTPRSVVFLGMGLHL